MRFSLRSILSIVIITGLLSLVSFFGYKLYTPKTGYATILDDTFEGYVAEVYYSPTCGCCKIYVDYLKKNNIEVNPVITNNPESIKNELGIPRTLWSCHTIKIGGYFVEGHVPAETIKKLLDENPSINGVALAEMPSGSPGMPGPKIAPFIIYAVAEGSQYIFETR